MKNELVIEVPEVISKDDIKERASKVSVKGFDRDKAEELGLFQRISTLLCAMHSMTMVSHRIYGEVDKLFSMAQIKRHEIKDMCNQMEKAFDKWFSFWRGYQTIAGVQEMNRETEDFYNQFLRWACIPKVWNLGDRQDAEPEEEPLIEIDIDDKCWRLYRDVAEREHLEEPIEEWGIMIADREDGKRIMRCIERGMDKASAFMAAKRMSANDPENMYVASLMETIVEKRIDIIPYKAYMKGDMVGDIKKVFKR